jgi:pimeloyl-ACP methyl ester carboxylesterase
MDRDPVERSWHVNGLELAGLCWGDETLPPILALHGWLDNAESFNALAPLLENYYVVAPDLTGHGRSSHRSQDATYQIWDDLPELMGIVAHLGWSEFTLMGHSRGAIISSILASATPALVRHLVLLDAVLPPAVPEAQFPQQLARFLVQKSTLLNREAKLYPALELAIAARAAKGLSKASATALARRGLNQFDEGYRWNSDPRLQGASAVKLSEGQNRAILRSLTMPTLLLQPSDGLIQHSDGRLEASKTNIPSLQVEEVPGGHHFHMDAAVEDVAARILAFLAA